MLTKGELTLLGWLTGLVTLYFTFRSEPMTSGEICLSGFFGSVLIGYLAIKGLADKIQLE